MAFLGARLWLGIHKYIYFFLSGFSFTSIHESQDCRGRGGHVFISSLPLPPASQTLRHWPGDHCRELSSAHSQQPDSSWEPLVSERKLLTTKLRALISYAPSSRWLWSDTLCQTEFSCDAELLQIGRHLLSKTIDSIISSGLTLFKMEGKKPPLPLPVFSL